MKPKHYPHATFAAATILLLLPVTLLLVGPNSSTDEFDQLMAEVDNSKSAVTDDLSRPVTATPGAEPNKTRVAMLEGGSTRITESPRTKPTEASPGTTLPAEASTTSAIRSARRKTLQNLDSKIIAALVPTGAGTGGRMTSGGDSGTAASSPDAVMEGNSLVVGNATDVRNSSVDEDSQTGESADAVAQSTSDEDLAAEMQQAINQRQNSDKTHFDATGHLVMAGVRSESSGRTKRGAGKLSAGAAAERRQASDSDGQTPTMAGAWPTDDDPYDSAPEDLVVDVIVQQPFEKRPVKRVENLIATTQQPGWPIALVRSDLPDDYWWVQQMVGIRNRTFASRVNFGNEHSLPGSVYHLVIVFLDSADEARRFRIAKQFKEIPEGLRRSREYTFVRK